MKRSIFCFALLFCSIFAFAEGDYFWEMEKGFGLDENYDGRIDIPNNREYWSRNNFDIRLGLTDSFFEKNAIDISNASRLVLLVEAKAGNKNYVALGKGREIVLNKVAVGNYNGILSVRLDGSEYKVPFELTPKKITIAAMGDSYMAGEGSPERLYKRGNYSIWADGGKNSLATLDHARSHRSSKGWPAQLALFLEEEDPHSSVIFIFLAQSGSQTKKGILGKYSGEDTTLGGYMPPQIEQLEAICATDKIDYLFLGTGGNDLGFVPIIILGIMLGDKNADSGNPSAKYKEQIDKIIECAKTGKWNEAPLAWLLGYSSGKSNRLGFDGFKNALGELGEILRTKFNIGQTYFVGYPATVTKGKISLDDVVGGFEINKYEASRVIDDLMGPLCDLQEKVCNENGWKYIRLIDAYDYSIHDYNSKPLYEDKDYEKHRFDKPLSWEEFSEKYLHSELSWFRRAKNSAVIQGAAMDGQRPSTFATKGTIHPNEIGFQAIMHAVLKEIKLPAFFPAEFQQKYFSER